MKSLYVVNTVYQLMMVINMRMHNIPEGDADILVSDHTPSLKGLIENLKKSRLFGNVFYHEGLTFNKYFWKLKDVDKEKAFYNAKEEISKVVNDSQVDYNQYSDIYLANLDAFFKFVKQSYPHLTYSIFEDGAGTCAVDWKTKLKRFNYIKGFNDVYDEIKALYIYSPDLMCVELGWDIKVLPKIAKSDKKVIEKFNLIFGFDPKSVNLPQIVFAEQAFQVDNIVNNDMEFMQAIYDVVGFDNLYIKTHPRNTVNRPFIQGLTKQDDLKIPFELLLLNCDTSKTIFVTVSSGSLISPWVIFDEEITTIFLYKAIRGGINLPTVDKFGEYLDKMVEKYKCKNLYIPKSLQEFKFVLEKLVKDKR